VEREASKPATRFRERIQKRAGPDEWSKPAIHKYQTKGFGKIPGKKEGILGRGKERGGGNGSPMTNHFRKILMLAGSWGSRAGGNTTVFCPTVISERGAVSMLFKTKKTLQCG